jgi:hypothetical protein
VLVSSSAAHDFQLSPYFSICSSRTGGWTVGTCLGHLRPMQIPNKHIMNDVKRSYTMGRESGQEEACRKTNKCYGD